MGSLLCRFFVYSIMMRNLIIIATSSKEILETINFFQIPQNIGRYLGKGDREVEAGVSLGGLKETEHICQLTNLITNSQLSKLFIEDILMNVLMWVIGIRFSWNFHLPPASWHFSIRELFQCRQKISSPKKTFIFLFKTFVEPSLTSKMESFAKVLNE